jgi:hypothetical protein
LSTRRYSTTTATTATNATATTATATATTTTATTQINYKNNKIHWQVERDEAVFGEQYDILADIKQIKENLEHGLAANEGNSGEEKKEKKKEKEKV